jgi:hypothetical protein
MPTIRCSRSIVVGLAWLLLAQRAAADDQIPIAGEQIPSYDVGRAFLVTITDDAILRSPSWRPSEANPPLAARKAISLAEAKRSKLVKDKLGQDGWTWSLDSAELVPRDRFGLLGPPPCHRWYWLIIYTARPNRGLVDDPADLRLAVLMDGTVVEPEVQRTQDETWPIKEGKGPGGTGKKADEQIFSSDLWRTFVVTITGDAIRRSPRWRPSEANPPLAARKAISLAEPKRSKLVKDKPGHDGLTWSLYSVDLVPRDDDRWYWLITYVGWPNGGIAGFPSDLQLVVLMDGTVVEPEVRDTGIVPRSLEEEANAQ